MLDTRDREFISEELKKHISGSEIRLMDVLAPRKELTELSGKVDSFQLTANELSEKIDSFRLAAKEDLAREIEALAIMTRKGFDEVFEHMDEIKYRLGNVEKKLDTMVSVVDDHDFDIIKLKDGVDKIKHHIGLP